MSEVPDGLYYTKEHEWIRVEGDEVVIGITDHAQDALTDIVYIELPEVGETCEDMGEFAVVESVKSASPIFAPLAERIGMQEMKNELEDLAFKETNPEARESILPSPLGAPEGMGVSQGLGRSGGKGWNFVGFARKAEEARGRATERCLKIA